MERDGSGVGREIVQNFLFFPLATKISLVLAKVGKSLTHRNQEELLFIPFPIS